MGNDADDEDEDLAGGSSQRWAADEETAMWDDSALRDSGYTALVQDREEKPREETGPATAKDFGGDDKSKVKVGRELTGSHDLQKPVPPKAGGPSVLSWIVTIVIAITVGIAVFFIVRLIRG